MYRNMSNITVENNKSFKYTYSAKQQKEVEDIRKKYLPKEEDKMETLRRLDRSAEKPGTMAAIIMGVIGSLILGIGMCCTMVWADSLFILGIVVGILGMTVVALAYPMYKKITKSQREKIAEQILALSAELSL